MKGSKSRAKNRGKVEKLIDLIQRKDDEPGKMVYLKRMGMKGSNPGQLQQAPCKNNSAVQEKLLHQNL